MRRLTIGSRLGIGLLISTLIPLLILGTVEVVSRLREIETQSENSARLLGQAKSEQLLRVRGDLAQEIEHLVQVDSESYQQALEPLTTSRDQKREHATALLNTLASDWLSIRHASLYSQAAERFVVQSDADVGGFLPRRLIDELATIQDTTLGTIYPGTDGEPLITIVVPVWDAPQTDVQGYVLVTHALEQADEDQLPSLYEAIRNQVDIKSFPSAYVGLFDESGQLLLTADDRQLFQTVVNHRGIEALQNGEALRQVKRYESPLLDERVTGYYDAVGPWVLVVEFPDSEVLTPLFSEVIPLLLLIFAIVLTVAIVWNSRLYSSISSPLDELTEAVSTTLPRENRPELTTTDETDKIGTLHNNVVRIIEQVYQILEDEHRANLIRQARLETVKQVARLVQQTAKPEPLLEEIVLQIHNTLAQADYVQVFVVDESEQIARLRTGLGDLGRQLRAQGYQQPLVTDNIVGRTVLTAEPTMISDLAYQPSEIQHDLLAASRSELAVPMMSGDRVVGVLDIHSHEPDTFSREETELVSVIATQVASVLAQQDTTIQRSQEATIRIGQRHRARAASAGVQEPADAAWTPLQRRAIETGTTATDEGAKIVKFAIPIQLRGMSLGAVEWQVSAERFNQSLLQMAEELVDRLALAIDNAQLFEQSQRLVERERLVNEISQKITSQTDVRQILQLAVQELGRALGTPDTQIALTIPKQ